MSSTEQSTTPQVSERAAGTKAIVLAPARMAIVSAEQPARAAVFMSHSLSPRRW